MLTNLFPRPRAVTLGRPGRTFHALPLRIADLADLEAAAIDCEADRLEAPAPGDMSDPAYRASLRNAVDIAERVAPGWGGAHCHEFVGSTLVGRAMFLEAALRHDGLTFADAVLLVPTVTESQWGTIDQIAFGGGPLSSLVQRVDRELGIDAASIVTVPWTQAIVETCQAWGLTLDQVGGMTIAQIRALRSNGEPEDAWGAVDTEFEMGPDSKAPDDSISKVRHAFYHEDRVIRPDQATPDSGQQPPDPSPAPCPTDPTSPDERSPEHSPDASETPGLFVQLVCQSALDTDADE